MFMNAKIFHRHPFVALSIGLDALYSSFAMAEQSRLHEALSPELVPLESSNIDEIVFLIFILGAGLCIDEFVNYIRRRYQRALYQVRIDAIHCAMMTVNHVVNNGLNTLLLIHMEAKKDQALSPETLTVFEDIIEGTAAQLRQIDALEIIEERTLGPDLRTLVLSTA